MGKVCSHGRMVAVTKVNIMRIKSMGSVYIQEKMVYSTLDNEKMGSNMANVSIRMYKK